MEPERREFIKKSLISVLGLFGLGFLFSGIAVFSPSGGPKRKIAYLPLLPEDEVPRSGVKKSELVYTVSGTERKTRLFLVSAGQKLTVLSATCSHLGCLVNYQKERREFVCPCHGGRYDLSGKNIAGPPPAPLTSLPFRIEQGTIMVGVMV